MYMEYDMINERHKIIEGLNDLRVALGFGLPDRPQVIQKYLYDLSRAMYLLEDKEPLKIQDNRVDEYYGLVAECPSCYCTWIMGDDAQMHYCPGCGKVVEWEWTDKK